MGRVPSRVTKELDRPLRASVMVSIREKRKYEQRLFLRLTVSIRPLYVEDLAETLTVQVTRRCLLNFMKICGLLMQK